MFLRRIERRKNGKTHLYWNIVENKRLDDGRVVQRHVYYLGEINSSQAEVWRKAVAVFDTDAGGPRTLALFPEDRGEVVSADDAGTVQRSGGSSRLRQLWAWRGDWIEHTTEPGAEHAVVDRAADLKKQIGASPRPSHLLRFIHSPVDQEIRGTFGN